VGGLANALVRVFKIEIVVSSLRGSVVKGYRKPVVKEERKIKGGVTR